MWVSENWEACTLIFMDTSEYSFQRHHLWCASYKQDPDYISLSKNALEEKGAIPHQWEQSIYQALSCITTKVSRKILLRKFWYWTKLKIWTMKSITIMHDELITSQHRKSMKTCETLYPNIHIYIISYMKV